MVADIQRLQPQVVTVVKEARRGSISISTCSPINGLWIFSVCIFRRPVIGLTGILPISVRVLTIRTHVAGPAVKYLVPKGVIHIGTYVEAKDIHASIQAAKHSRHGTGVLVVAIGLIIIVSGRTTAITVIHIPQRIAVFRIYAGP